MSDRQGSNRVVDPEHLPVGLPAGEPVDRSEGEDSSERQAATSPGTPARRAAPEARRYPPAATTATTAASTTVTPSFLAKGSTTAVA
jgi:hypothetical protein